MTSPAPQSAGRDPPPAPTGEAAAFWHLADSFRPYLKGVANRMLAGRLAAKTDSSDVVQQALLAAFEQRAQFRGEGAEQWRHWLLAIVRNEVRNLIRYFDRQKHDAGREKPMPAGSSGGVRLAGADTSPSQQVIRREQAARLVAAVEQLPPDYAEIIRMRNFEDLAYADIAARMGRSELAVRQLWKRAIERLRAEWRDDP